MLNKYLIDLMKKIFMSGCGGMLGEAFYSVFKESYELKCTDIDVNESWLELLDFRDLEAYSKSVKDFKPDYLFHIGAYTDLEYCEQNKKDTFDTNTESVKTAVAISNKLNLPLLYISTAGIFDGLKDYYDESDTPKPMGIYVNTYGTSNVDKSDGEIAEIIENLFDMRPASIEERLKLPY